MSDLTDRLRDTAYEADVCHEAAAVLDAIDALHQERDLYDGDPYCLSCDQEWPCATYRALHPRPS